MADISDKDTEGEISSLKIMASSLRTARGNYDSHWQECARFASPRDALFNTDKSPGSKERQEQYHEGAELSLDESSSMFKAHTTPDGQRWHGVQSTQAGTVSKEDKKLYDEIEETLFKYRYLHEARYSSSRYEVVRSMNGFGNGFMYIEKGPSIELPIRYRYVHLSQCYMTVDNFDVINGLFYIRELTPTQIVGEYGEENVPTKIIDKANSPALFGGHDNANTFRVAHSVLENKDYDPESNNSEKMKYSSRHFLMDGDSEDVFLRKGGYNTFPYIPDRDAHSPNEVYGRGTLQKILPAIKMLNQMKRTFIIAGHNAALPTLLMSDDSSINPAHIIPEGIVVGGLDSQNRPNLAALDRGQRVDIAESLMEEENRIIERAFHLNLYISKIGETRDRVTATEVRARLQEQSRIIGPQAARDEVEFLGPQIAREIDILDEWGLLPDFEEFDIIFHGVLAMSQKSDAVVAANNTLEAVLLAAQADPIILKAFSFYDYLDVVNEGNGAPARLVLSREEFDAAVTVEQQAQAQQQIIENAAGISQGIGTLIGK